VSAIQLIKNSRQRKQTILKVCLSILERQHEFLDLGIDMLKPMMNQGSRRRKLACTFQPSAAP